MKQIVIFNIENLGLDAFNGCIARDYVISNNDSEREFFYTKEYRKKFGSIETEYIKGSSFAYSKSLVEGAYDNKAVDVFRQSILTKSEYLEGFLSLLWLIKDNSVYTNKAFGQVVGSSENLIRFTSNNHAFNANGCQELVSFSEDEIKRVDELSSKYGSIFRREETKISDYPFDEDIHKTVSLGVSPAYSHNDNNSIQRAFIFLAGARRISYLPYRIAMYMPMFECLFCSDASEVTQKISERVAFYLSKDQSKRKEIYSIIKAGYDLRSKFLHGQLFKNNHIKVEYFTPLSKKIDEFARLVMTKIIMQDSEMFIEKKGKEEERRKEELNDIIFT